MLESSKSPFKRQASVTSLNGFRSKEMGGGGEAKRVPTEVAEVDEAVVDELGEART